MNRRELKEYLSDKKIIFVDDDESICNGFEILTNKYFEKVYVYNNPQDAIDGLKEKDVDMVISDITMPDINGFEMVRSMREIKQNFEVIFISGHNESEYLDKMREFGGHYIIKPINHQLLFEKIIEIFKSKE
jgi:two-component system response regulator YesN